MVHDIIFSICAASCFCSGAVILWLVYLDVTAHPEVEFTVHEEEVSAQHVVMVFGTLGVLLVASAVALLSAI